MDFVKHPKDKTLFVAVRLQQFVYYLAILFITSSFNFMVIGFLWWYFLLAGREFSVVHCSSAWRSRLRSMGLTLTDVWSEVILYKYWN